MAQTKTNLKIRALLKGVELNSLSNAYEFEFMALFIVPVLTLNWRVLHLINNNPLQFTKMTRFAFDQSMFAIDQLDRLQLINNILIL